MKKLLSILLLFACHLVQSQTVPQGINYQAVALDQSGQPIPGIDIVGRPIDDAEIGVHIAILENSPTGNILYQEVHEVRTDLYGMFNLVIGQGLQVSVDPFSNINWQGDKFLQVKLSIENDGEFVLSAVQKLMSVPYSFLAENAMVAQTAVDVDDADADPSNELQSLSISGDSLTLSNGNTVQLTAIDDADADPNNEIQVLSISNDTLYLSNGGYAVLPADQVNDADADPSNEIQTLSKSGSTISLTNGGSVTVFDGNYNNLSNTPTIPTNTSDLTNDSGFLTAEVDSSITNELQLLSISNDTIYLSDGGFVKLPAGFDGAYSSLTGTPSLPTKTSDLTNDSGFITVEVDGSITNELQLLSMSNDTLYLTDGGFVVLPSGFDGDYNNLTNTPAIPSKTSDLTNDSGFLTTEQDSSMTNELQTLSISNDTVFLSNGGFVKLPAITSSNITANSNYHKAIRKMGLLNARSQNDSCSISWTAQSFNEFLIYSNLSIPAGHNNANAEDLLLKIIGYYDTDTVTLEAIHDIYFQGLSASSPQHNSNRVEFVSNSMQGVDLTKNRNIFFRNMNVVSRLSSRQPLDSVRLVFYQDGPNSENEHMSVEAILKPISVSRVSSTSNQTLSISNDTIFLTDGGFVKLPSGSAAQNTNWIRTQFLPTQNIIEDAVYYEEYSSTYHVFGSWPNSGGNLVAGGNYGANGYINGSKTSPFNCDSTVFLTNVSYAVQSNHSVGVQKLSSTGTWESLGDLPKMIYSGNTYRIVVSAIGGTTTYQYYDNWTGNNIINQNSTGSNRMLRVSISYQFIEKSWKQLNW